ncbi:MULTISPECIES: response regulator transcription factor [unclassified Pseudomonas]|uniref:response regulator transcription factor n=2 Tax=unclassified Pseudomonas TaxID=196821 RepID=UPI0021D917AC|nr:response regulator transcription factor [Pseudomonas sp. YeP6b]
MSRPRLRPYTVMLLDDHRIIRYGIAAWLATELDIKVVGSYATSKEFLAALTEQQVDVVLIDFMLGDKEVDGINLIRTIKLRHPACKILVLSSHYSPATVALAMQTGSLGFYGKSQELEELGTAIRKVAVGQVYLHPAMAAELEAQAKPAVSPEAGAKESLAQNSALSPKEQEVLRCFLDGMSVNDIAAKFSRSANTISTQKKSAFRKLGIKSDGELFKLSNSLRI